VITIADFHFVGRLHFIFYIRISDERAELRRKKKKKKKKKREGEKKNAIS